MGFSPESYTVMTMCGLQKKELLILQQNSSFRTLSMVKGKLYKPIKIYYIC